MRTYPTPEDKLQRQLEIEQESLAIGVAAYREDLAKGIAKGDVSGNAVYSKVIAMAVEPVAVALQKILDESKSGKAGRRSSYLRIFDGIDPYEAAFLAVKSIIGRQSAHDILSATSFVHSIGRIFREHFMFKALEKQAGGLVKHIKKSKSQQRSNAANIRYNLKRAAQQVALEVPEWSSAELIAVGEIMVKLVIEHTGMVQTVWVRDKFGKGVQTIVMTPEAITWIQNMHNKAELLTPALLPMIIKPNDWKTTTDGGYLSIVRDTMVHTNNRNFASQLEDMEMPVVYKTINTLQAVPWRLNQTVYEVAKFFWEQGGDRAGLPRREHPEIPAKPSDFPYHLDKNDPAFKAWKAEHYETWVEWKRSAKESYIEAIQEEGQRIMIAQQLWMADRYHDEEEFYFPYFFDWRGRVYSQVALLSPQSNDLGKGMLQFAKGKRIGATGAKWLKIHVANTFGVDKVSFEERLKWVEEHELHILQVARDPYNCQYWMDADSPFCFLAACFEYAGYIKEGEDHISHIAIAMDGSNNGLQHFSMMLRDQIGGKATNVIPSDTPQDIYMEVVKAVRHELAKLAGNMLGDYWYDKVNRALVKRNVMTVPYSVTKRGMVGQLISESVKQGHEGSREPEHYERCKFLAEIVYDAIGRTVVAARQAQDWLKEVAKIAAGEGLPLYWKTPAGFIVCQDYLSQTDKRVDTEFGSMRIRRQYKANTNKRDKTKMAAGISANMVHSLDAAHLMRVVNQCAEENIHDFALIHDSYGVHASEVDKLHRILREQFIEIYRDDWLAEFEQQLREQLPPEVVELFPERPQLGTMDIESVKDSQYFFA